VPPFRSPRQSPSAKGVVPAVGSRYAAGAEYGDLHRPVPAPSRGCGARPSVIVILRAHGPAVETEQLFKVVPPRRTAAAPGSGPPAQAPPKGLVRPENVHARREVTRVPRFEEQAADPVADQLRQRPDARGDHRNAQIHGLGRRHAEGLAAPARDDYRPGPPVEVPQGCRVEPSQKSHVGCRACGQVGEQGAVAGDDDRDARVRAAAASNVPSPFSGLSRPA